jgi:hypothetical protein
MWTIRQLQQRQRAVQAYSVHLLLKAEDARLIRVAMNEEAMAGLAPTVAQVVEADRVPRAQIDVPLLMAWHESILCVPRRSIQQLHAC